jgi:hypothetical protein
MEISTNSSSDSQSTIDSLSYINDLVVDACNKGEYEIFVDSAYMNDTVMGILTDTYGYRITKTTNNFGTYVTYIISWFGIPVPSPTPTPTKTLTPTPTPSSTPTGFGSSGFQWMTINSVTSTTASGIGQNDITISVTQSKGGMQVESSGMYSATTFPQEYGVPTSGTQIRNTSDGVFTATFSQPVTNPLIAFASVGNPGLSVPVQSTLPFTPIWSTATTYQNLVNGTQYTQFTGAEGFNIIRIDGTLSSVSFTYTVSEFYCTVCFGFVNQNNLPTPTPTPTPTSTP